MSDRATRMEALAFAMVIDVVDKLTEAGVDDKDIEAEALTCLMMAYILGCKCAGHTFEDVSPIIEQGFKASYKAKINSLGGVS